MRFMQSADGKICDNSAEEIRTCPPMNRWPRLPTSLWAVGKLIFAPPPMTNASAHSPSALSPQSKCPQYRLSVGLASISMKHGQSCHMQKTCALSVNFAFCSAHGISQAENVCFGTSFVKQISAIAVPLLLILTCLMDALYRAKYISMPHPLCRLYRLCFRADNIASFMRIHLDGVASDGW